MPLIRHEATTSIPPDILLEVLTDFESYPEMFSMVQETRVEHAGPPVWEVYFKSYVIRTFDYRLRLEVREEGTSEAGRLTELRWSLIDGFFVHNNGRWQLLTQGETTTIRYELTMQLATFLPQSVRRTLTGTLLTETFDSILSRGTALLEERSLIKAAEERSQRNGPIDG